MNNKLLNFFFRFFVPATFCLLTLLFWLSASLVSGHTFAQENVIQDKPSAQAATNSAAPEAPSSISGRVTDLNGAPLATVEVGLIPADGSRPYWTTTTDIDGTYTFDLLGAGLYRIVFAPVGSGSYLTKYYPNADLLADAEEIFVASSDVQTTDVALTLGGSLVGTIRTTDGQPLSELEISVDQNLGDTETPRLTQVRMEELPIITPTNTVSFSVQGLADGLYQICARGKISGTHASAADCYEPTGSDVDVAQDINITQGITTMIDFQLMPETLYTISGTVTSPVGEALPNVKVSLYMSKTNPAGWYRINKFLSGTVRDPQTDETGHYQIEGLRAGTYTLHFWNPQDLYIDEYLGYAEETSDAQTFTLGDGSTQSTFDFIPREHASISGAVTSESGQPLAGIQVSVYISATEKGWYPVWFDANTDENGEYRIQGINLSGFPETAHYTLGFSNQRDQYIDEFLGHSPSLEIIENHVIRSGEQLTGVNFVAREGASVEGQVTIGGVPFNRRFKVEAHKLINDSWTRHSHIWVEDEMGAFRIQGLASGQYKFGVRTSAYNIDIYQHFGGETLETATQVDVAIADNVQNIDIDLGTDEFDGVLAGRVIYEGESVENIMVEIDRQSDGKHLPTIKLLTDADGQFRVEGVLSGSYCIRYTDPNGVYATNNYGNSLINGSCQRFKLEVGEARTDLDHSLTIGGSFSGQISDYTGQLLSPVEVTAYVYNQEKKEWSSTEITTMADENGRYTLHGLLPRTYRIGFRYVDENESENDEENELQFYGLSRSVSLAKDISVDSGEEVSNVNIILGLVDQVEPRSFLPFIMQTR